MNNRTGLVAPLRTKDGGTESVADVIREELREPYIGGQVDAKFYLDEGIDPSEVVTLILLRNTGLSRADAVEIVKEFSSVPFKPTFILKPKTLEMGDAPPVVVKADPRLERILAARADAERYLAESMTAAEIETAIRARNNISVEEAHQIVERLTGTNPAKPVGD
jgi:hypothetical protein